ncbi:MAG: hypothetical protein ACJ76Z_09250 [Thermoleophilaceae bacterium]
MRQVAVAVGLALGVLVAILIVASGSKAHAATPAPARLFVSAKEWSLVMSRQSLRPGSARIQLYDAGEDAHDLRLRRVGGTRTLAIGETQPGAVTELRTRLRPGKWKLWCSLPGHRKAGMVATLTVRA